MAFPRHCPTIVVNKHHLTQLLLACLSLILVQLLTSSGAYSGTAFPDTTGRWVLMAVMGVVVPGQLGLGGQAGHHNLIWNGTDSQGRNLSSGAYLLRMTAKDFQATRQMMLIR